MKERPILFSAPMVRAILACTKTQTRRVMSLHPSAIACCCGGTAARWVSEGDRWHCGTCGGGARLRPRDVECARCPYGQPGDRLWVRETWRVGAWLHRDRGGRLADAIAADYRADGHARREWLPCRDREQFRRLAKQSIDDAKKAGIKQYSADTYNWDYGKGPTRWRPSIHMPRWASRLLLEVASVRVERLQSISPEDALAEGIVQLRDGGYGLPAGEYYHHSDPSQSFFQLWADINGPGSVEANPWVWVNNFKRLEAQP